MATFTLHKDKLVECPFDKNHKIAVRNQIKHIIECEKKVIAKFSVCIFNASHRMPRNEFAQHIKDCPDGRQHTRALYLSKEMKNDSIQTEVKTNASVESQVNIEEKSDKEDSDNWDNDNCPQYSIYGTNEALHTNPNCPQNNVQKLTKNQKKRNRRKTSHRFPTDE